MPLLNPLKRKVWQAMRIMRKFNLPDLVRTSGHHCTDNQTRTIKLWIKELTTHGVIEPIANNGGAPKEFQAYRLVRDTGPDYPHFCDLCQQRISHKICFVTTDRRKKERREKEQRQDIQERRDLAALAGTTATADAILREEARP